MDSGFTNGNNGMAAGVWTDVSGLDKKTEASRTYVVLYVEGLSASDSANDQQILFSLEPDDENIDAFPVAEVRVTVLDPVVSDALSGVVRTDGSVSFTSVAGGLDGMLPWSPQLTYSTQLGGVQRPCGEQLLVWRGAL